MARKTKKPKNPADDWEDEFQIIIPVKIDMSGPLMSDDFIPRRQLTMTFSSEDLQDVCIAERRKEAEVLKNSIIAAMDDYFEKLMP